MNRFRRIIRRENRIEPVVVPAVSPVEEEESGLDLIMRIYNELHPPAPPDIYNDIDRLRLIKYKKIRKKDISSAA